MTQLRFYLLPAVVFSLAFSFYHCKYARNAPAGAPPSTTTTDMPNPSAVPPGDYAREWQAIDSLEKQGLFKSALEQTEALYRRAKADGKGAQVIKTLLFRGKYTTMLEEDGYVKAVQTFENEEKTAGQPERAILQSLLGELYKTYLENQGWRIQDRTPIPEGEGGDILTWSAEQIERRALDFYSASVEEQELLTRIPVDYLRDISRPGLQDTVGKEVLRPTLFDLLGHRALAHFSNERSYLMEPAYKFYLDQEAAFAPADDFVRARFETRDSSSYKWKAIRLFQRLMATHQTNRQTAALIDADLLRLQFARNNAVMEDKADRYFQALAILHKTHYNHPSDAEIVYNLAQALLEQDSRTPNSDGSLLKQAVAECENAISRHPGTYGARQCEALLYDLKQKHLYLEAESVYLPDKPALVSVSFKNTTTVWVKVVAVANDPEALNAIEWEQQLPYLNGLPAVQQRRWTLPDPGDYRQHRTELALEPLPAGRYFVLVSSSESFDAADHMVTFAAFTCSRLAGISYLQNAERRFVTVDRESGVPLAGVQGDFFDRSWDRNERRNVRSRVAQAKSDDDGMMIPEIESASNYNTRLSLAGDTLWLDTWYSNYRPQPGKSWRTVQFFTDRSLYRPGQTVYFKGVALEYDERGNPRMLANTPVTVRFLDVNGQEKGKLDLYSSTFGTVQGTFQAPASGLTGRMQIRADKMNGAVWFNVEEYKRPRFEASFKPVEGAYRIGDTVQVRGEAKNYAGSSVDGAKVRYRVVREVRFPWWDWGRKIMPYFSESMEIANGETTTGADGSFAIDFPALPDRAIPKKEQPMFHYSVTAEITDITGETRSAETHVTAGYVALQVQLVLPNELELDSLRRISLNTTNTAGRFQAAEGTFEITALDRPRQFFVKRYWETPDVATLKEPDFRRDFPSYAWMGEDDPAKWPATGTVRTVRFNTAEQKTVDLHGGQLTAGYYQVVLKTRDPYGEPIEIRRIVRVWDAAVPDTRFEAPGGTVDRSVCEPGESARIWLGGRGGKLMFLFLHTRNGEAMPPSWIPVSGAREMEMVVGEGDRGGLVMSAFAVQNNRFYGIDGLSLQVPWSNKQLSISYETFRDKLTPGQKEEWRLKISGPGKDKVAAEMVATLYDASLDQFLPHEWSGIPYPVNSINFNVYPAGFHDVGGQNRYNPVSGIPQPPFRVYRELEWFDFPLYGGRFPGMFRRALAYDTIVAFDAETYEEKVQLMPKAEAMAAPAPGEEAAANGAAADEVQEYAPKAEEPGGGPGNAPAPLSPRRNLNETVFFFPVLRTDEEGNIILKFTMNEALTRWRFLAFAHTRNLEWALSGNTVVTQKELMVITNPPRFLREGDELEFTAKVSNLSGETIRGTASLKLFDAASMQPAEKTLGLSPAAQSVTFTVAPGQSAPLAWRLKVPEGGLDGLTWQVFAEGNNFRDGEENTLPVLTNRMLVTETMPITVRGNQSKTVVFDNLKDSNSGSLRTHRYTLEFTSNPAWYAVQALPYMMEFPFDCNEQIFSRFYANTLAAGVTQKLPALRRVYDKWKTAAPEALKSNLSKNQELKTALLEETPWVLDAQSEEQQKQNIALLFDLNRMANEQERDLARLSEGQSGSGGWPWFPGGPENWFITQHIVAGFGHLDKLGVFSPQDDPRTANMIDKAMGYCDREIQKRYKELERAVQRGETKWEDNHLDGLIIQYLYARSFYPVDRPDKVTAYYLSQGEQYWLSRGLYEQGMLALALHRHARPDAAGKIVASLRERALVKEELGMYWPFDWGAYWYQLPVETQALMVEVFDEVAKDPKAVEELRIWLLKNKQTNRWESTKATAEAVYALLLHGDNWLENTRPVQVSMGGKAIRPAEYEPGTGYFKESWQGKDVRPSWATIKVDNPNSNLVWGAAYWQYFEDLDKIKSFRETPLTIVKQLFREENTPTGPVLKAITANDPLHPGDKIKVRIELRVDRAMEFVHLKDMRASGLEPINVLSGYRWQDGLGYYESTRDLATHFFVDYMPRGTYVFEYPLVVNHRGDFSNGITTLQCMYAPEFTSHSEGIRVRVE